MLEILSHPEVPPAPAPAIGVFEVVKNPVDMLLTVMMYGDQVTLHYNSVDSAPVFSFADSSVVQTYTIPSTVTKFYLKQTTTDELLAVARISGPEITSIDWNEDIRIHRLTLQDNPKLIYVSPYSPKELANLTNVFYNCTILNADISEWDTSLVTVMFNGFRSMTRFNQDISSWDTGNVTSMGNLLRSSTSFNQNLSGWDVSKVTNSNGFDNGATAWQSDFKPKFV